jgi:hypothetical protein
MAAWPLGGKFARWPLPCGGGVCCWFIIAGLLFCWLLDLVVAAECLLAVEAPLRLPLAAVILGWATDNRRVGLLELMRFQASVLLASLIAGLRFDGLRLPPLYFLVVLACIGQLFAPR